MRKDKDFNLAVGMRIREIREAFNMTREEFSEKCDISASFLTDVESGKKAFTTKILYKICTATNVSADYFILGREKSFEADMLIELLNTLPKPAKEVGLRIFHEYVGAISHFTQQCDKVDKN